MSWLDRIRWRLGVWLERVALGLQLPEYTEPGPLPPPPEHPITAEQFMSGIKGAFPPASDDEMFAESGIEARLPK